MKHGKTDAYPDTAARVGERAAAMLNRAQRSTLSIVKPEPAL